MACRSSAYRGGLVIFSLAVLLAACSGGGGGGVSLPPAPAVQQTAAAINTAQIASSSSTTPVVGGVVYGVFANTINIQGGSGCGYVNVSYSGSTQIITNGYSLTPGVFASVYGTGNCGTSFTATKITLSATTVAVAGPIYGVS